MSEGHFSSQFGAGGSPEAQAPGPGKAPQAVPNVGTVMVKEKRKRQTMACDACRKSKRRCDGKVPCELCISKNIPCTFDLERRRQTKKDLVAAKSAASIPLAEILRQRAAQSATPFGFLAPQSLDTLQNYRPPMDVTQQHSMGFMAAANLAIMADAFFEHYSSCFGGVVRREFLVNPSSRSEKFVGHAALALVNRSYGDPMAKLFHEKEGRELADTLMQDHCEETVVGYCLMSFYYGSECLEAASLMAKIGETVLAETEAKKGRSPDLMRLRGMCRSLRSHADLTVLMELPYRVPNFLAGEEPDIPDSCSVQRIISGVLAELIRVCPDLQYVFFSDTPFSSRVSLMYLAEDKAKNLILACEFAMKELGGYTTMPFPVLWSSNIALLTLKSLCALLSSNLDLAASTMLEAISYRCPSSAQILSSKSMTVPFLAGLAIVAENTGRHDMILEIANILLRLGKVFRTAWVGYNTCVTKLPPGIPPPAPVCEPPPPIQFPLIYYKSKTAAPTGSVSSADDQTPSSSGSLPSPFLVDPSSFGDDDFGEYESDDEDSPHRSKLTRNLGTDVQSGISTVTRVADPWLHGFASWDDTILSDPSDVWLLQQALMS